MNRICTKCGEEKSHLAFYRRMGCCKDCWKAQVRARARTNPAVQAYDRARAKLPHRRFLGAKIRKRWREENPQAYRAQTALGNAMRDGKIKRQPCEVCGAEKVHAHHDDYSRPLEVRWLCPLHHHRHHADTGVSGKNKRAAAGGAA